jgi:hypothetical protein
MPSKTPVTKNLNSQFYTMMTTTQKHLRLFTALLAGIIFLAGCSSPPPQKKEEPAPINQKVDKPKVIEKVNPLSPYSTEGLYELTILRDKNYNIGKFLDKHPKPDYFFSTKSKKIYFVYLGSNDLYIFHRARPDLEPKRYSPLPASIKRSIKSTQTVKTEEKWKQGAVSQPRPFNEKSQHKIEQSLKQKRPQPYLDEAIVSKLISSKSAAYEEELSGKLFYLDLDLYSSLENEYSAKYEPKKKSMKLIFRQAYSLNSIYDKHDIEAKKIFFKRSKKQGADISIVVPNFFPGSKFYKSARKNIHKAFASLYTVKMAPAIANNKSLRIRYIVKLCQKDGASQCVRQTGTSVDIRGIVIAATLYDRKSGKVIDTLMLK